MNCKRINNLMHSIINDLSLDLNGMSVLTECASDLFAVTPLIAALAGAERVVAISKDSRYGLAEDNIDFLEKWAVELGVENVIHATTDPAYFFAKDSNIVTNLNFLRPIGKEIIEQLPPDSCIPLMWEPWEFRDEDLDLPLCNKHAIPVLGTNESNPRLNIFRYVGLTALKLLFELNIEVFNSKILIIGGDPFGKEADEVLSSIGATNIVINPKDYKTLNTLDLKTQIASCDAVVVLENHIKKHIIGGEKGIPVEWLADSSIPLVHICGKIDDDALCEYGVKKHPDIRVESGYMTVTTAYMGPRAIVDLHAAGLKVGEIVVNSMRRGMSVDDAKLEAVKSGIALDF